MDLNQWFDKGMTWQAYVDGMKVNREGLQKIYDSYHLPEEDLSFYEGLAEEKLRAVVLTADWCGDAMLCLPILKRIAEAARIQMRYLIRDENLELMDQYLTNGKSRSIPIFVFFDSQGNERAVWGPRSPEVQWLVDEMKAKMPAEGEPDFAEKQKDLYRDFKKRLLEEPSLWETVNRSVRVCLQEKLGS